jgi:hypothetical protein
MSLSDHDQLKQKVLREVFFCSPSGKKALDIMLCDLKFFEPCETPGEVALNNYAKELVGLLYAEEIERRGSAAILEPFTSKE